MNATQTPNPLPYHRSIVEHLRAEERGLWDWFSSSQQRTQHADSVRLDLLKSTYRLDPASRPKVHELADEVRQAMKLDCAVTLYQSQSGGSLNAALAYLPNEAHVIFSGPLVNVLSEGELRAVLAHELGHYMLYAVENGDFLVAQDLIRALAADAGAGPAAAESGRLFALWTEIYADRWAAHVAADSTVAIAALLKTSTGLEEVSAEAYLKQAEEIFSKSREATEHVSHPEPYIRARALKLWANAGDAAQRETERMIEGGLSLQRLDLLGQKRAAKLTRQFFDSLLAPSWFRTEGILAHAARFFPDYQPSTEPPLDSLRGELEAGDDCFRDYFGYLMLDFLTADRELGDPAVAAAIVLARKLDLDERFAELVHKELGVGKKAYAKIEKDAESILARTAAAHTA